MKKIIPIVGLIVLMLGAAGCFASKSPTAGAAACPLTYELDGAPKPLGSATSFTESAADALAAGQPTTLASIAEVAGWRGTWDRMVIVKKGMPADYVARIAQTPDLCWTGIPDVDDRWASNGYYVFMRGAEPIQSVEWQSPMDDVLGYAGDPVVGVDVLLQSNGNRLYPQP